MFKVKKVEEIILLFMQEPFKSEDTVLNCLLYFNPHNCGCAI